SSVFAPGPETVAVSFPDNRSRSIKPLSSPHWYFPESTHRYIPGLASPFSILPATSDCPNPHGSHGSVLHSPPAYKSPSAMGPHAGPTRENSDSVASTPGSAPSATTSSAAKSHHRSSR